jgi:hypothetical protein
MTQDELEAELKKRGIELQIGACGCCSSPWVAVKIDGEKVFDDEGVSFDFNEDAK